MRKPDVVHLSLPISKKGSANILTPNRSSYRLPTINQHATLIQGTRLGVVADPAQAHSLRILASPGSHVDGEAGLASRPMYVSKPLRKARVPLSTHISDGTMLPVAPAQVVPVPRDAARIESISPCYKQYASPTEACWADRVRMRRTGVRPLHAVCQSERSFSRPSAGARRDCPPRVSPRPGSAWLAELSSTRLV